MSSVCERCAFTPVGPTLVSMHKPTAYEIVIAGHATERLLRPLTDDFVLDHPHPGQTRLVGVVADAAHLHGVLNHLTAVAAEVIRVAPIETDPFEERKQQ